MSFLRSPILALIYFSFLYAPISTFAAFGRVNAAVNVLIFVLSILNILVYKLRQLREANSGEKLNRSSSLPPEQLCRRFSLAELQSATNDFDESMVIGKGGFGITYKGVIDNGTCRVAMKRLKPMSKQGAPEFRTEIVMLTKVKHCHVISLIGYCDSEDEMILVYEYMERGNLADHLHKLGGNGDNYCLPWIQRLEICIEAARGIDYLHTGTCDGFQHVIHRDMKSSNILLDDNWTGKISDFGYSTIGPTNTTSIKGTVGYRDPARKLTFKSDVYAFGVVLFEVLSGSPAVDYNFYLDQWLLAKWAQRCIGEGKVDEIIDPKLRGEILPSCLSVFVQIANQCLDDEPEKRPTMAEVVVQLESALVLQGQESFNAGGEFEWPEPAGSPIVEGEIYNSGGTYDRQEHDDSSVVEGTTFNSGGSYHTELSSTFEASFNSGGTYENQELEGSSVVEDEISNAGGTYGNQEHTGALTTAEVLNADNGVHQDEKIDGTQSPIKSKRMKFTEKARIFLFGSRDR